MNRVRLLGEEGAEAFRTWVLPMPWDLFCTLTFDSGRREYAVSNATAERRFFRWLGVCHKILERPVAAIGMIEPHASGEPHIHALLDCGGITQAETNQIYDAWYGMAGLLQLRPVPESSEEIIRVIDYVVKEYGRVHTQLLTTRQLTEPWRYHGRRPHI